MTLLTVNNVAFKPTQTTILQEVNFHLAANDFLILLGSNGSGKSSLLKLLHRHQKPTRGEIHFMGQALHTYKDKKFGRHVAFLTQHYHESLFISLTVFENYALRTKQANRDFFAAYLAEFNANLANKLDLLVTQLSGGEKQALALALCLLHPPQLLLLDEHTSALDPKTSAQIMQLTQKMLKKHNITCILTTHDLDLALSYGNRIAILKEGRIAKILEGEEKAKLTRECLLAHY